MDSSNATTVVQPRTTAGHRPPATTDLKIVPLRHPLRWAGALTLLVLVASWAWVLVTTDTFEWDLVGDYMFNSVVLDGVANTLYITVASMLIGITLGTLIAIMRLSPNPVLTTVATAYLWFFRGIPTLLQLIFWFNLASVFPRIDISAAGITLVDVDTNTLMTPLLATLLGLGLNLAAYYSEFVRAGILSIDEGQTDAAAAYGMTRAQMLRHIILPQAMRVIIPPTGNEFIGMLKWSSLASVISYSELLHSVQGIYNRTFEVIPLLIVASLWYLAMTTVLTIGQHFVEKRFSRGSQRTIPTARRPRILSRLLTNVQMRRTHT